MAVLLLLFILSFSVRIVPEYRRLVLFRLGRLVGSRGPGIVLLIPLLDRAVTVDLRILTLDVPVQEVITKDNVAIKVNAVVYFSTAQARLDALSRVACSSASSGTCYAL